MENNELYHHGVKGMKWGVRKVEKYRNKAAASRKSADDWDKMSKYAGQKGKTNLAKQYTRKAGRDRSNAQKYDTMADKAALNATKWKDLSKEQKKARVKKYVKAGTTAAVATLGVIGTVKLANATVRETDAFLKGLEDFMDAGIGILDAFNN